MIRFRLKPHAVRKVEVCEILDEDGSLLGVLYPEEDKVRLVSKHLAKDDISVKVGRTSTDGVVEVRLP